MEIAREKIDPLKPLLITAGTSKQGAAREDDLMMIGAAGYSRDRSTVRNSYGLSN